MFYFMHWIRNKEIKHRKYKPSIIVASVSLVLEMSVEYVEVSKVKILEQNVISTRVWRLILNDLPEAESFVFDFILANSNHLNKICEIYPKILDEDEKNEKQ